MEAKCQDKGNKLSVVQFAAFGPLTSHILDSYSLKKLNHHRPIPSYPTF